MPAEYKHALRRLRGQMMGWSFGVAVYGLMMAFLYENIGDMSDMFDLYLDIIPEAMLAFFQNIHAIATPMGYIDVYFFSYLHLVVGILAISAGAGLLAGDEERGILDLVLAHPVSRGQIFFGRFLGLGTALGVILTAGWLSWALPAKRVGLEYTGLQLLLPFLPLLAVLLLFAALALFFSMVLPAARMAGMLAGALLVANYLFLGLANLNDSLKPIMKFTPLRYYQGGMALDGLERGWLAGLFLGAAVLTGAALALFLRRDIRVGGERSWKLPDFLSRFQLRKQK